MGSYGFDNWLASEIDAAEREAEQDEAWSAFLAQQRDFDADFNAQLTDPLWLAAQEQRAGELIVDDEC